MKDSFYIEFGLRLRHARETQGLSREELAEMSGLSSRHISSIELGDKCASPLTLSKLVRALGISSDVLFCPDEQNNDLLSEITHSASGCSQKQQELILRIIREIKDCI